MKLYSCITGPGDESFCKRVSEKLNNGWELHGSPALAYDGTRVIVAQALIKEVYDEEFTMETQMGSY